MRKIISRHCIYLKVTKFLSALSPSVSTSSALQLDIYKCVYGVRLLSLGFSLLLTDYCHWMLLFIIIFFLTPNKFAYLKSKTAIQLQIDQLLGRSVLKYV